MGFTKAKLYTSKSEFEKARATIETALGIPHENGTVRYCEAEQVRSNHPEHANKYILPLEIDVRSQWRCDHLVTGEIAYDPDWKESEEGFHD